MIDLYVYGLICTSAISCAVTFFCQSARGQIMRTIGAIVACWIVGYTYIHNTQNWDPWAFNILLDGITALAIMWRPAGNAQGYIGILYCIQIAMHIGYGIRDWLGMPTDRWAYYDGLTFIAWCQLLVLAVWAGGLGGKRILDRYRPRLFKRLGGYSAGHPGEPR